MATTRFTFRFAELSPPAEPALRVLAAPALALPAATEVVEARPRPRWMPRLLPVFRAREPLRVDVLGGAAPPFAARLRAALAAIFAAAGAEAGVAVVTWPGGLAVGGPRLESLPAAAQAVVVAASLERGSVAAAADLLRPLPEERAWLAVDGAVPAVDAALGLDSLAARLAPGRLVRLPILGRGELGALARGGEPGMARRASGLQYLGLAVALARAYVAAQP